MTLDRSTDSGDADALLRDALRKIRELRQELEIIKQRDANTDVALVGCGLRLPGGVHTLDQYAELMFSGRFVATPVPSSRWDAASHYNSDAEAPGKTYAKCAAFLDDVAGFDPLFFGISPREAIDIDPQQRLLLETVWEALEDAGIAPERLRGSRTGVYVAQSMDDYMQVATDGLDLTQISANNALGNARSLSAGRISYTFDLLGPCLQLDTACSSSLVGVHLARQALLAGEIDFAIVAGANLMLSPMGSVAFSKLKALAPDGRCKPFDAAADGYGRGEGVAAVVLQRATDARAQEARIHGVIRSTAVNHDGKSNGLTAPNGRRQEDLLRAALASARVTPQQVLYVEAHGTGTPLGDPIEMAAIGNVYARPEMRERELLVGSVKANIGHLEAAAGMASLLKLLVIARHRTIPPTPHFHEPNRRIPWASYRLKVANELEYVAGSAPFLTATSCFGMSGTNVHLILESSPPVPLAQRADEGQLLCASARNEVALRALLQSYVQMLGQPAAPALADICYTAAVGRNHFEWRAAFIALDAVSLRAQLEQALHRETLGQRSTRTLRPLLWFAPTWPAATVTALLRSVPLYAQQFSEVHAALGLRSGQGTLAQQAFLAQHALAQCLLALGVNAAGFGGEGVGWLVAAVQAQTMTLQQAFAAVDNADARQSPADALPHPMLVVGISGALQASPAYRLFDAETSTVPREDLLQTLSTLYALGAKVDWAAWYASTAHRTVSLPTYPFQRGPYWRTFRHPTSSGRGINVSYPLSGQLRQTVEQHRLFDVPVAPGALHLSLCHAALHPHTEGSWLELTEVSFVGPLVMAVDAAAQSRQLRVQWLAESTQVVVQSENAVLHLKGRATLHAYVQADSGWNAAPSHAGAAVSGAQLYEERRTHGIELGPLLRWIETFRTADGEVFATLSAPEAVANDSPLMLHPGLIDSCFHLLQVLVGNSAGTMIPVFIERAAFKRNIAPSKRYRCHARLVGQGQRSRGFLRLYADDGLVMVIEGLRGDIVDAEKISRRIATTAAATVFDWTLQPLLAASATTEAVTSGAWLLAGDNLHAATFACLLDKLGATALRLPFDETANTQTELVAATLAQRRCTDILWFMATSGTAVTSTAVAQVDACLTLVRQLVAQASAPLRIHLVNVGDTDAIGLAHASLEALARSVSSEISAVRLKCWQLPSKLTDDGIRSVLTRLRATGHSLTVDGNAVAHAHRLARLPNDSDRSPPDWSGVACLVTGAGGALGQSLCRHLATRGAARLYMTGRHAPDVAPLREFIEQLGLSCEIVACELDVADYSQVLELLNHIKNDRPALRAVFHLAGVLKDRGVLHTDRANLDEVFAPKAAGAWHLHEATCELELDAFICYSSVAAVLPSPGQSAYSAANAFLNGLCALRRSAGLPGQSVCWGPWDSVGMASELGETARRAMRRIGVEPLRADDALAALDLALGWPDRDVLILACARPAAVEAAANAAADAAPLPSVVVPAETIEITEQIVVALATEVMELGEATLDPTLPLERFGLDSLMSMDLLERLNACNGAQLPLTTRLMEMSAVELVDLIRKSSSNVRASRESEAAGPLRYLTGNAVEQATCRVLCLHYLGGDASCFTTWPTQLGNDVEFRTVDWPRLSGLEMVRLAQHIADELCALPPLPLYFYGHSMGGLLAYEVASRLDARHQPLLRGLTVGAMWPPDVHREVMRDGPSSFELLVRRLHADGAQAEALLDREGWRRIAEADWAMMKAYAPGAIRALDCDIIAMAGEEDQLVSVPDVRGWKRLCNGAFTLRHVPGGHFFVHDSDRVPVVLRSLIKHDDEQTT